MRVFRGNIIDVIQGRIYSCVLSVENGQIVGKKEISERSNHYILPGLVDAHVHVESSMLTPQRFAELSMRQGTIGTVSDPHEIANVLGTEGVDYMIRDAALSPARFYFGAPACVPATNFESPGASLGAEEVDSLLAREDIYYLSEVMNYPGVIHEDPGLIKKIRAAKKRGKPIDGHAPGMSGQELLKYVRAGIQTDHECIHLEEALEKIKAGMHILIREGSASKNFEALWTLLNEYPGRVMLCTDDIHPDDLYRGHINRLVYRAREKNVELFKIIRACTLNPVRHYGLDMGLLQAGDPADFIMVDHPDKMNVMSTYIQGEKVFEKGDIYFIHRPHAAVNKFNCNKLKAGQLKIENKGKNTRVIEARDRELWTGQKIRKFSGGKGFVEPELEKDYLKIVVVNRYQASKPAIGFVHGFGLKKGAMASSIAHDSHNLIATGTSDEYIAEAINLVIENKGGIAVVHSAGSDILPLPVAGLMSEQEPLLVGEKYAYLTMKVKEMGSSMDSPFMTLSFMALLVIPELKISDFGLFDVQEFKEVSLFME